MSKLLDIFAGNSNGMAKREFDEFQSHHQGLSLYTDPQLDNVINGSANFKQYPERTVNAPAMSVFDPSKSRIHQALAAAGWDVNGVTPITDLGVPVFNDGGSLGKGNVAKLAGTGISAMVCSS